MPAQACGLSRYCGSNSSSVLLSRFAIARGSPKAAASQAGDARQQQRVEVAHALVPLHRLVGDAHLLARDAGLPQRGRQSGGERDEDARDARARGAVALDQPHESQAHAGRPRRDRLAAQVPLDVLRELRGGGVALWTGLAIAFSTMVSRSPRQRARQRLGSVPRACAASAVTTLLGRGGCTVRIASSSCAARVDLHAVRRLPRQQPVQHDAERVDVGRGGERLAGDLLGAGVVGREQAARCARQLGLRGAGSRR